MAFAVIYRNIEARDFSYNGNSGNEQANALILLKALPVDRRSAT